MIRELWFERSEIRQWSTKSGNGYYKMKYGISMICMTEKIGLRTNEIKNKVRYIITKINQTNIGLFFNKDFLPLI